MGLERLTGEQITSDPAALLAAACSISMFGGQTIVRVDGVDDKAAPALARLLDAPFGNPVIAVAEGLKKSSPLLALASHPAVLALESKQTGASGLKDMAAEFGLRPDREALQMIFEANAGDRTLIRSELEKLALYVDARPDAPQQLDAHALKAVAAGIDPFDPNALLQALLAGSKAEAVALLGAMPDGFGIVVLRQLASRLTQLAEIRLAVDRGQRPEAAVEAARPPVFFKEKPVWLLALRRFTSKSLAEALAATLAAERAVKSSGSTGDLVVHALIVRLARV
jgi:DNA polymerase-3 subunit delta